MGSSDGQSRWSWYERPIERSTLPDVVGAYVLEFVLESSTAFRAGALGQIELEPGPVRYYGSAHGPGGLAARVARHLRTEGANPHWHVDYLVACHPVDRLAVVPGGSECQLCRRDARRAESVDIPLGGFGASDCSDCPAHLLAFPPESAPRVS